jgi:cell wall-associated NlpC family hydrolase
MTRTAPLSQFIGIPYVERGADYAGADCWGVCLLYARDVLGLQLPRYFYTEGELLACAGALIERETAAAYWQQVQEPYEPGTVHILRVKGMATHCGIHVAGHLFLHSLPGRNSCIESLFAPEWLHRLTGSYHLCPTLSHC